MILSARFTNAITYAISLHEGQNRKNTDIPYISHLLAVTAIVLEEGGDEDLAIAAILHDAVEDQGGMLRLIEIRKKFGDRVASIVEGCSDSITLPKPLWRTRKVNYLEHLQAANHDVLLVSLADKVHNSSTICKDLKKEGVAVWDRFNGGKEGTLWYYKQLVEIFSKSSSLSTILINQFIENVKFIEDFIKNDRNK